MNQTIEEFVEANYYENWRASSINETKNNITKDLKTYIESLKYQKPEDKIPEPDVEGRSMADIMVSIESKLDRILSELR